MIASKKIAPERSALKLSPRESRCGRATIKYRVCVRFPNVWSRPVRLNCALWSDEAENDVELLMADLEKVDSDLGWLTGSAGTLIGESGVEKFGPCLACLKRMALIHSVSHSLDMPPIRRRKVRASHGMRLQAHCRRHEAMALFVVLSSVSSRP